MSDNWLTNLRDRALLALVDALDPIDDWLAKHAGEGGLVPDDQRATAAAWADPVPHDTPPDEPHNVASAQAARARYADWMRGGTVVTDNRPPEAGDILFFQDQWVFVDGTHFANHAFGVYVSDQEVWWCDVSCNHEPSTTYRKGLPRDWSSPARVDAHVDQQAIWLFEGEARVLDLAYAARMIEKTSGLAPGSLQPFDPLTRIARARSQLGPWPKNKQVEANELFPLWCAFGDFAQPISGCPYDEALDVD